MPSFARPELLLALALAPVAILAWARARRPAIRYPALDLLDGLATAGPTVGLGLLRATAMTLLLVAAAGVRVPDYATPIPAPGITIELVIDVSGSMAERDFPSGGVAGSRLDAAKGAARDFVAGGGGFPGRPDDRIGLLAFAELPRADVPPTLSHGPLIGLIEGLESTSGLSAGTSVGDALAEALDRLTAAGPGRKVIVLVSDGEENGGGRADALPPLRAARLAEALGVPVYAIDCSPPGGAGPELLARVARLSGGERFRAADADAVRAALERIDSLERVVAAPPRYRRFRDLTGAFAALGAVTLAASGILARTRWAVAP